MVMESEQALADRELGQFPVSIGTSLALEGAFGIYPEQEQQHLPVANVSAFWINVTTVFRNLFHTLSAKNQDQVSVDQLAGALASEIPAIESAIRLYMGEQATIHWYRNTRRSIEKYFPNATVREATTHRQKIFKSMRIQALDRVTQYLDGTTIHDYDTRLQGGNSQRAVILTHVPLDLLSHVHFRDLQLLESHTGRLRPMGEWGGKFHTKDDTLPFTPFMLQLLGDHVDFSPKPIRIRRYVLDIAKRQRWSPTTKERRIRSGVRAIQDDAVRDQLMSLFDYRTL